MENNIRTDKKLFTISEFRRELGIPLVLAKKMVVWGMIEAEHALDGTIRIAESEIPKVEKILESPWKKGYLFFRALGPGLITGASDDDPGGIGTYSSVGAKFGLAIIWMAAWLLPMMLAVQEACARIGIVTNRGLAGVMQHHYKKKVVALIVLLLVVANVMNIGADLGAMAASAKMVVGGNFYVLAVAFALFIIAVEIFVQYHVYVKVLKWLTVSVLAYIATGFIIHPDWLAIFKEALIPHLYFDKEYLFAIIAVFGTSITPYLFFWQTSEEVEDGKMIKAKCDPCTVKNRIGKMRTDVGTGMILANVVFFFIVLTTAQVLFKNGIHNIGSAEEAALALQPLAGQYAFLLFALGIVGTGLLAVPILAGSGAYALSELFRWREGLELKFSQAKGFYWIITLSILAGLGMNFFGINPIAALYYSAFLNGLIALPLLFVIMVIGDDKKIMGTETHPWWVRIFGWGAVVFMVVTLALALGLYL
jgi:Mn2+/Fe2+ NRAMP family transporter